MMFIVTLIALLIERFFDWSHLRQWHWYDALQRLIYRRLSGQSAYLVLAINIIPLLIVMGFLEYLLMGWLYGFIRLLFQLFVLLYCLGPQNLWADTYASINALMQGDPQLVTEKMKNTFGITATSDTQTLHRQLVKNIFIEANQRVFATIFWFAILGAVGALLYRLVILSAVQREEAPELTKSAATIQSVLDWIPVRIFTFIFALGGHFVQVFSVWRKNIFHGLPSNEVLLVECGFAALDTTAQSPVAEDGSAEKGALSLLDRTFVIILVILAVVVLVV